MSSIFVSILISFLRISCLSWRRKGEGSRQLRQVGAGVTRRVPTRTRQNRTTAFAFDDGCSSWLRIYWERLRRAKAQQTPRLVQSPQLRLPFSLWAIRESPRATLPDRRGKRIQLRHWFEYRKKVTTLTNLRKPKASFFPSDRTQQSTFM